MKLAQLVTEYITFKQSMGMRFRTESAILKAFCRAMGNIDISSHHHILASKVRCAYRILSVRAQPRLH
jgi:hypothetical protein